jgi:EAL domain-containing protein (putative c-di-GMP-specific phosphodiesterase class I)
MPLQQLVTYFNERICKERGLAEPPLSLQDNRVEGRYGDIVLSSVFHRVRLTAAPDKVVGHEACLRAYIDDNNLYEALDVFASAEGSSVIDLDRLCRTIHMLNYLPNAHEESFLFLYVNPRHVLNVRRNHGAYFEEVLFRCGLTPQRVIITIETSPGYSHGYNSVLIEGLTNYRERGYGIALKLDSGNGSRHPDLLRQVLPNFVRLDASFLNRQGEAPSAFGQERIKSLVSVIHELGGQALQERIETKAQAGAASDAGIDLVMGAYYDDRYDKPNPTSRRLPVKGVLPEASLVENPANAASDPA